MHEVITWLRTDMHEQNTLDDASPFEGHVPGVPLFAASFDVASSFVLVLLRRGFGAVKVRSLLVATLHTRS